MDNLLHRSEGLFQQRDGSSWRTRWSNDHSLLKYILAAPNPALMAPPIKQFPRAYGGPTSAEQLRERRATLRAQLQAVADRGDQLAQGWLDAGWLDPDPLEPVRDALADFLAAHQPSPLDKLYGNQLDKALEAFIAANQED